MFKLHRTNHRSPKSNQQERVDFKFSNFQALQVPKGWDKLSVSLISVGTGKKLVKSGKALVRNGYCQWTESLSESILVSRDNSSKGYEECLVKLVISMDSNRPSILGEATINMAHYINSKVSTAVSQTLKKCSHGTILQVKIQCATPISKTGDEESKRSNFKEKDRNVEPHYRDSKSNGSCNSSGSPVEPRSQELATTSCPLKSDGKESVQSASGPSDSFDSQEEFIARDNLSANVLRSEYCSEGRLVRGGCDSGIDVDLYSVDDYSPSNQSSCSSSKNLPEAAEYTIEEFQAEAKVWDKNDRKLMMDLDMSRKKFSDLSKKHAELSMELSTAYAEKDGLKTEVENSKLELQKLISKQAAREDSIQMQKVLENEIKNLKDLNADLGQQLKGSNDSNIELISVLQELEDTIEQQKIEISSLKLNSTDFENSIARYSEDNRNLLLQLQQLQESEKRLQADIQLLQDSLRDQTDDLEKERRSYRQMLNDVEKEYEYKISVKEEEIARLKAELSGNVENNADLVKEIKSLRIKVEELEKDCAELTDENLEILFKLKNINETDIQKSSSYGSLLNEHSTVSPSVESELSVEVQNTGFESSGHFTEILEQLDMAFRLLTKPWCNCYSDESKTYRDFLCDLTIASKNNAPTTKTSVEDILSVLLELNKLLETRITDCDKIHTLHEMEIKEKNVNIADTKNKIEHSILGFQEEEDLKAKIEANYAALMKELDQKRSEVVLTEANLLSKEQEANFLAQRQRELEAEVSELQNIVNSHISAKTILERNFEELERKKYELENTLSGLQENNMQWLESISGLEAQVRILKDEKEYCLQEMENLKTVATTLQGEIEKTKIEMGIQISDLKQKSEDVQKQWLGAKEECEHLKNENKTLQESADSSVQEITELQNSNLEMKRKNQELVENFSSLVAQLSKSKKSLSDCSIKVELLEDRLTSAFEDFSVRKSGLESEVDALVQEKFLHLENEFTVKEIQNAELENKLTETQRENIQFQLKVHRLEEEKDECSKKTQALEEQLNLMEQKYNVHKEGGYNHHFHNGTPQEAVAKENYKRTKSSLETELRDLKDRYLEMSLKYAEVETEREDLVMKLKATRVGKRWF